MGNAELGPKRQVLGSSELKEFADEHFKFDKKCQTALQKGRKHCGKGEIAGYEQFLLFSQCFQMTWTADM